MFPSLNSSEVKSRKMRQFCSLLRDDGPISDDDGDHREGEEEVVDVDSSSGGPGSCSRTLPFRMDFPGIKFCTRTPGGMLVHLPRKVESHGKSSSKKKKEKKVRQRRKASLDRDKSTKKEASEAAPRDAQGAEARKRPSPSPASQKPQQQQDFSSPGRKEESGGEDKSASNDGNVGGSFVSCCKCDFRASVGDPGGVLTLTQHLLEAHHERIYVCPGCPGNGTYYYQPGTLRRHLQTRHPGRKDLENELQMQVRFSL